MKCYTDNKDVCHNPNICEALGYCNYEKELSKINEMLDKCQDPNGCVYTTRCINAQKCQLEQIIMPTNQPRIPEFIEILEASKAIHLKKNQDYANDNNPFANFERSAELISWFNNSTDKAFISLIGTKLARIAELSDGRTPNNESLDDSFLDLVTYCGLWAAYSKRMRGVKS